MLAFAYAWGYGFEYPGGRFLIPGENLVDLRDGVTALAEAKGVVLSDPERAQPDVALRKVKQAFERGERALLVIDNLEDAALLAPQARERALPRGEHIHVLVTTRVSPENLERIKCLPLDALSPQDALALLQTFRPIADSPQDDQWKAALEIVRRLDGHALAVEVVGVFLRENSGITCRDFVDTLERDGISLLEEEVGPEARGRLAWHTESCIARLLEPTIDSLSPPQLCAVQYAALLPPDNVALPWLRELLVADFPHLQSAGLADPVTKLFQRLERLRLVVPADRERDSGSASVSDAACADTGPNQLARMHRLVQDVICRRMEETSADERNRRVQHLASAHAAQFEQSWGSWGRHGVAWELAPLYEVTRRMLEAGDRSAVYMADRISTGLKHSGRLFDVHRLWQSSIRLLTDLARQDPENADYARDLSVSYERMGDLFRALGDGVRAREFYEKALEVSERLAAGAPENADYARDLAVSYHRMGL